MMIDDDCDEESPPLDLLSLPDDTLLYIFSFVYQCQSRPTAGDDILSVIRGHNDLHTLHTSWSAMRPLLREFSKRESFLPPLQQQQQQQQQSVCPFAHRLKIIRDNDVRSYSCSGETRGGTGREGIVNLLRDGNHAWNKWYDPTLRLDTNPYYTQLWLHMPVRVLAYGIKSANDVPGRDPKDWRLLVTPRTPPEIGYYQTYQKFSTAHQVHNHIFTRRYETAWNVFDHALDPAVTIRLAIDATPSEHAGTQISQLYLVVVDD